MPTFTEVLPATKTGPAAIDWTPGAYPGTGLLVIKQKRAQCEYVVSEFATGWEGRAVQMLKPVGEAGTDKAAESYDVFVHRGGRDCRCCCKGFDRWGNCKHIEALKALLANGWLDLSPVNPDQDTGPTEQDDQPEPAEPDHTGGDEGRCQCSRSSFRLPPDVNWFDDVLCPACQKAAGAKSCLVAS